jgi:hypothetical protein
MVVPFNSQSASFLMIQGSTTNRAVLITILQLIKKEDVYFQ